MPTTEREIPGPVDLCDPRGRLNAGAVGWTRGPLHRANLRGWGRTKRWEYWGVVTPTHVVGMTVSSLDYAALYGLYLLDRTTGREIERSDIVPLARGVVLPERTVHQGLAGQEPGRATVGTASGRGKTLAFDFAGTLATTTLRGTAPGVEIDLTVRRDPGHEALGVVVTVVPHERSGRSSSTRIKDVLPAARLREPARPRVGAVEERGNRQRQHHGDREHQVDDRVDAQHRAHRQSQQRECRSPSRSPSWTSGRGPASGRTSDHVELGRRQRARRSRAHPRRTRETDGTGSTENALLVDGRLHKIGEELHWEYDRTDWLRPWRISGETVDVTVHPFHERADRDRSEGCRVGDPPVLRGVLGVGLHGRRRAGERGRPRGLGRGGAPALVTAGS